MALDAVRTVVAVVDIGRFQNAAADPSITQRAVSKRIAGCALTVIRTANRRLGAGIPDRQRILGLRLA